MFLLDFEIEFLHPKQLKERQANGCAVIVPIPGTRILVIGTHIIRRSIAKVSNGGAVSTHSLIFPFLIQSLL